MGYYYLIKIDADELDLAKNTAERELIEAAVGKGIVNLCCDLRYYASFSKRKTYHSLGHTENAISLIGEIHSTDFRVYAYCGNRMLELQHLEYEELLNIKELLEKEITKRNPH